MNPTEVRKSEEWTNPALSPLHALNPVNFASEGKNETSSQPGRNKFSQFSKRKQLFSIFFGCFSRTAGGQR